MEKENELYDLSFLRNFAKGDSAKVEQYIRTYLRTSERIFAELEQAELDGHWDDLYIKAHSVKPQVQYMGIASLQEVLVEIEQMAKFNPEADKLNVLVAKALILYRRSYDELGAFLSEKSN